MTDAPIPAHTADAQATQTAPAIDDTDKGGSTPQNTNRKRPPKRITHGCGAWWTGLAKAHCAACHRTFGSITAFDRHRHQQGPHGGCHHPADVGLVEHTSTTAHGTYTYWTGRGSYNPRTGETTRENP